MSDWLIAIEEDDDGLPSLLALLLDLFDLVGDIADDKEDSNITSDFSCSSDVPKVANDDEDKPSTGGEDGGVGHCVLVLVDAAVAAVLLLEVSKSDDEFSAVIIVVV